VKDFVNGKYGKDKDVSVSCVSYRNESWHWDRMGDNCPLMRSLLVNKILKEITFEAEKEIDLRRDDSYNHYPKDTT
jgi:hypothetical protein